MEKSNLRQRVEEIALAKKVGLRFDPRAEEIAKLEERLKIQDAVMDELSKSRGETMIELWKLRGEKTYGC